MHLKQTSEEGKVLQQGKLRHGDRGWVGVIPGIVQTPEPQPRPPAPTPICNVDGFTVFRMSIEIFLYLAGWGGVKRFNNYFLFLNDVYCLNDKICTAKPNLASLTQTGISGDHANLPLSFVTG
jgi:hypothetical protein